MPELLDISPLELKFRFELKKNIPVELSLTNPGADRVAFKVKTTNPKGFCVRPSSAIVEPGTTKDVQVVMQAQRDPPPALGPSRDKFLVQYVKVGPDVKEVTADAFDASKALEIKQTKVRVSLVGPPKPPSPVSEGVEDEPSPVKTTFKDIGNIPPPTPELPFTSASSPSSGSKVFADSTWKVESTPTKSENKPPLQATKQMLQPGSFTSGYTVFHLLLVAVLAFIIGHYT